MVNSLSMVAMLFLWMKVFRENMLVNLDDKQKFILELTYAHYGRQSAWGLRKESHTDFPG